MMQFRYGDPLVPSSSTNELNDTRYDFLEVADISAELLNGT